MSADDAGDSLSAFVNETSGRIAIQSVTFQMKPTEVGYAITRPFRPFSCAFAEVAITSRNVTIKIKLLFHTSLLITR